MKKQLLIFVALLFAAMISLGANKYVDPLGTDDGSHGSTTGTGAYKTIQYAITAASADDVINVAAGTYAEDLAIAKNLTLKGTGVAGQVIISGLLSSSLGVTAGTVVVQDGIQFTNATNNPTIAVSGGSLKIRNCVIYETNGGTKSCLDVTGGVLDAGKSGDKGLNMFLASGTGFGITTETTDAVDAIGNFWGSAKGPKIASNYCGSGAEITGTYASAVTYSPWKNDNLFSNDVSLGSPVTTVGNGTVCSGGTTLLIPVTVTSFNNVGILSLKLIYDASKLGTPSLESQHASLWTTFTVNVATSGVIKVSGYGTGFNLTDGATLFTLRFTKSGGITTSGTITFDDSGQGSFCEYAPDAAPSYQPWCDKPKDTYYIAGGVTVVADPTLDQPGDVTICKGGSTILTTDANDGTGTFSYQWQYCSTSGGTYANVETGTPSGITYTNGGTASLTIAGNGSEASAAKYYKCLLTTNTPAGAGCNATTTAVTVTTVADPSISVQPAATTSECIGGNVQLSVTAGNGTPSLTYQWYSNTVNNTEGVNVTLLTDETNATYTPPTTSAGTMYYFVIIKASGSGCNDKTSDVAAVTVVADPSISVQPAATTSECIGGNVQLSVTAGNGTPSLTYQWYSNTVNSTEGVNVTLLTDETNATYTPPTTSAGTMYYFVIIKASGSGCNDKTSDVAAVTVVADPSISVQPAATTSECIGGNVQLSVTAGNGTGGYSYQWYSNTTSTNTGGTLITDETNATYTPPTISAGTVYYYVVVHAAGNGCTDVTSDVATIIVVADPSISVQPAATTSECIGGNVQLSVTAGNGTPSLTYQWYSNTVNSTEGVNVTLLTDETNATYTPPATSAGTMYYFVIIKASGSGCNDKTSDVAAVTVVADPSISVQPAATTSECIGGNVQLSVTAANGTGGYSYQWYSNTTSTNTGGTLITDETNATYTPPTISAGTMYYFVIIKASGSGCNDKTSDVAAVTVVADPSISVQPAATTSECIGGNVQLSVTAGNGTPSLTYQWYSNIVNSTTGDDVVLLTDETNATYTPPAISAGTMYYFVIIKASGSGCNDKTSDVAAVTVVTDPTWATNTASQSSTCVTDNAVTFSATVSGGTGGSVTWLRATSSGGSGTLVTSTDSPGVGTWYYRPHYNPSASGCNLIDGTEWVFTFYPLRSISGSFTYYNAENPALVPISPKVITVGLYKDNTHVGSNYSATAGSYVFNNLCPGTYEFRITSDMPTDGSVNTTDAAQANYWGAHPYSIEKVRFYAGDVTLAKQITATSAQRIQGYFVNGTAFDRPDWTFWNTETTISANPADPGTAPDYPTVILVGSGNITANMYGLCTGDFNRSFDPLLTKSSSSSLSLIHGGTVQAETGQEFDLPVHMVNAAKVGAVSLILNFPADLVEVKDVVMNSADGQLDWAVKGNELRIGWNSLAPADLAALANLVTLKLKTTAAFTNGASIRLVLAANPLNELADDYYDVIGNALLSVDVVEASPNGIALKPASQGITLQNYPNPFAGHTTIAYTLPFNGKVILEIHNTLGKTVEILMIETQQRGDHLLKFDATGLASGIYTATIRLSGTNDELIRTIKLVNNR